MGEGDALFTDLYELTMLQAYFNEGMEEAAKVRTPAPHDYKQNYGRAWYYGRAQEDMAAAILEKIND